MLPVYCYWILGILFGVPALLTALLYVYASRNYNHWKKRSVPFKKPSAFFGNFSNVFKRKQAFAIVLADIYHETKIPYIGIFLCDKPVLLIKDYRLLKSVLVKDFDKFSDRTWAESNKHDPLGSQIMFFMKNPHWAQYRKKITPSYSSGKIKTMYSLITETGEEVTEYLSRLIEKNDIINCKEAFATYATELITSTAFGIKANCLKNEDAEFRKVSRRVFNFDSLTRSISTSFYLIAPELVNLFHLKFLDSESATFLQTAFDETMVERRKSNIVRNDLIDIIMQMQPESKTEDDDNLDNEKLLAQAIQFFFAGFETVGNVISMCMFDLAMFPDVQDKLREEVRPVLEKYGHFSYEQIHNNLVYLDMVVKESLRKYPTVPFLDRRCNENYHIPGTDDVIEKGIGIYISVLGMHRDPDIYPEPEKFIPERFSPENVKNIPPYAYLPFGEGPRNCLGARFANMAVKTLVAHVVANFKLELPPGSPDRVDFHPGGFFLAPHAIKLRFKKI